MYKAVKVDIIVSRKIAFSEKLLFALMPYTNRISIVYLQNDIKWSSNPKKNQFLTVL